MIDLTLTLPVRVGLIEANDLTITESPNAFDRLVSRGSQYREECAARAIDSPAMVEGVAVARRFYRAIGVEPTKTRPSSEALLRRAMKEKPFHQVNTLVDVGNWCSLDFLLPIGLYDRSKIRGAVTFRQGRDGECYEGIGKPPVNVAGRYVLVDDLGPFGSPTSDSLRTCISLSTTQAWMTIFAPLDYDASRLRQQTETAARRIVECCGGGISRIEIAESQQAG